MKTVRKWAEHLPEPIRSQFLENVVEYNKNFLAREKTDLASCIGGGFAWVHTPQGWDYWDNIYDQARSGRFDIPPHIQAATIADDEQAD